MRGAAGARGWTAALAALALSAGCTKILGLDYTYQGPGTSSGAGTSSGTGTGGHGAGTTTTTTGSTGSTGSGGASACGSFVWDPQVTCQGCMESFCCSNLHACDTGTPCASLAACIQGCKPGDDTCNGSCIDADTTQNLGSGLFDYVALYNCFGANCDTTTSCSFPVCTGTYSWTTRACSACLSNDAGCCAAFAACANDSTCNACMGNPEGTGCSASATFHAVYVCQNQTCGLVCAYDACGSDEFGYYAADCNYCVSKATGGCCMQFDACVQDITSTCYKCLDQETTTGCGSDANYIAYNNCLSMNCDVECQGF